jgi:hypothetical protein
MSQGHVALVDDEDYELVSKYNWHTINGYASASVIIDKYDYGRVWMHRLILEPPEGKYVDHINRNRSDNRRSNLRIVSRSQNGQNRSKQKKKTTSKFKGVVKANKKYSVHIGNDGAQENKGSFSNELAAANAYNYYARLYYKEYACLNDVELMEKEEWESYRVKDSSMYKGVSWSKKLKCWETFTMDGRKKKNHGYFDNEEAAGNYINYMRNEAVNTCKIEMTYEECLKYKRVCNYTSKYKGVSWAKKNKKWSSAIGVNNGTMYIGLFDSEKEAAIAYNNKVIELGLNRKLNIIN